MEPQPVSPMTTRMPAAVNSVHGGPHQQTSSSSNNINNISNRVGSGSSSATDSCLLPKQPSVSYTPVAPSCMHGLEAALSSSVLLGNGSVSGAVASSASAKASACAGELTLLAGQLQAGCRALYAYRGVTRNIQEARGDVDAARLSGTWMQVLLPELRKVAAACATAADAQAVLMRLLASGGCGVSASTSSGNRSMAPAKASNEAHASAAAASSSGHGWLPPNVSAAAMQVVDGLVVMDTLLNSKQTILVDLRWFQSALELQRQSTAMHPDGSVSPSLGPSPMAMHGAMTAEADAVCAQLLPLLSRPWPLVHTLSSSIAALPPVLAPTVGRVLAHWLEHESE